MYLFWLCRFFSQGIFFYMVKFVVLHTFFLLPLLEVSSGFSKFTLIMSLFSFQLEVDLDS